MLISEQLYSLVRFLALALVGPERESKTIDFAPCWASHLVILLPRPPRPPVMTYVAWERIKGCPEILGIACNRVSSFGLFVGLSSLPLLFDREEVQ